MKQMKLQDLLAPAWDERTHAAEFLMLELLGFPEPSSETLGLIPFDSVPSSLPKQIHDEICELKPSPEVFLSALVAFWADVSEQKFKKRIERFGKKADTCLSENWSSPHLAVFPMTPVVPPVSGDDMYDVWVWSFISRLIPYAKMIERQLIACLDHPVSIVHRAAESALGTVNSMAAKVAKGRGKILEQPQNERVAMVLNGFEPGISEKESDARFIIIRSWNENDAQAAYDYLLQRIDAPWSNKQLGDLIDTLLVISEKSGFKTESVSAVKQFAQHHSDYVRSSVAFFLASHSADEHYDMLKLLAKDGDSSVPLCVCLGLEKQSDIPPDLLRAVISKTLDNYDCHDNQPHESAVNLLIKMGESAKIVLPEILAWWDRVSAEKDYKSLKHVIEDIFALSDTLGISSALAFKPGLERALNILTTDYETVYEEELIVRLRNTIAVLDNLDRNSKKIA